MSADPQLTSGIQTDELDPNIRPPLAEGPVAALLGNTADAVRILAALSAGARLNRQSE